MVKQIDVKRSNDDNDIEEGSVQSERSKKYLAKPSAPPLQTTNDEEHLTEVDKDENLGEDFESTRWLPPSIEVALEYRKDSIYR